MLFLKAYYDPTLEHCCVEVSVSGLTTLRDLLVEAEALATRLECGVQFEFNGRVAWILPGDNVEEQHQWLLRSWEHVAPTAEEVGAEPQRENPPEAALS